MHANFRYHVEATLVGGLLDADHGAAGPTSGLDAVFIIGISGKSWLCDPAVNLRHEVRVAFSVIPLCVEFVVYLGIDFFCSLPHALPSSARYFVSQQLSDPAFQAFESLSSCCTTSARDVRAFLGDAGAVAVSTGPESPKPVVGGTQVLPSFLTVSSLAAIFSGQCMADRQQVPRRQYDFPINRRKQFIAHRNEVQNGWGSMRHQTYADVAKDVPIELGVSDSFQILKKWIELVLEQVSVGVLDSGAYLQGVSTSLVQIKKAQYLGKKLNHRVVHGNFDMTNHGVNVLEVIAVRMSESVHGYERVHVFFDTHVQPVYQGVTSTLPVNLTAVLSRPIAAVFINLNP